jgi:iron complex transport system substrate-binding protein
MPRVVSLIASATEIVCALGFEGQLVGRSHECDFPESVKRLPVCTEPKFNVEGSSYEIDQRVKGVLQEGLSVYRVHADVLRRLRPDVIVTQSHCEVCAVSQRDVEQAVCDWLGTRPQVVSLAPNGLADVWDSIRQVAAALGAPDRGEDLIRRLKKRISTVAEQAQTLVDRPTVAFVEWIDPLMAGGNWMPELIALAGGVNLFGEAGKHSPWMTWEELRQRNPEVIFVAPCGFDLARTRHEMAALTRRPDWPELRAVRAGRVYLADGNQYFNRPGPRVVESLEILAEALHPEVFHFGHGGMGSV